MFFPSASALALQFCYPFILGNTLFSDCPNINHGNFLSRTFMKSRIRSRWHRANEKSLEADFLYS